MQIVINMPKEDLDKLKRFGPNAINIIDLCGAIVGGTPLPEPYEDAVSRSAVLDLMRTNWADNDGDTAMQLSIDDVRNLPTAPKTTECEDAVSREAVLKKIFIAETLPIGSGNILKELSYSVENMPSVTPKQRTGKWIHHEDIIGLGGYYRCSCCDKRALYYKSETAWINTPTRYCPNCGAKMEGEN